MAYNNGREDRKWRLWKEAEAKKMREYGVDESTIEELRTYDKAIFNSDRRFYQRLQEVGTYLDDVVESEQKIEVNTVLDLLNEIEDENLYRVLLETNKLTLQIVLLKMQG